MKRKTIAIISMICCMSLTACGSTEEQKDSVSETTPVQTENVQESTIAEPATEAAETVQETANETEVFGDVDMAAGSLTMADMVELEIGTDIPFIANSGTDQSVFEGFTVLFPGSQYITEYYEDGVSARSEAIDFEMSVVLMKGEPNNNIREEMGESQENVGKYVLEKTKGGDTYYVYRMTYNIVDPDAGNMLNITITINKKSDYQNYCDELVAEFAPKFEEVLYSNLQ